jgi:deoxyribonuclease-4
VAQAEERKQVSAGVDAGATRAGTLNAKLRGMRIGIHTSTAGNLANSARKAHALGANCFQIFSASPRMWRASAPDPAQVLEMKAARAENDLTPLVIHDSYLINLASFDPEIRAKSIAGFRGELERASAIGAEYLVMHPGSAKGYETPEEALETLANSLENAAKGLVFDDFCLLFENTAGGGATIGRSLEELKTLREMSEHRLPFPVGFCLDTCHLFASGHDVSTKAGLEATVSQAEKLLGLNHVPVIHINDSKGALNSHLDRHENIGK